MNSYINFNCSKFIYGLVAARVAHPLIIMNHFLQNETFLISLDHLFTYVILREPKQLQHVTLCEPVNSSKHNSVCSTWMKLNMLI